MSGGEYVQGVGMSGVGMSQGVDIYPLNMEYHGILLASGWKEFILFRRINTCFL